MRRRKGLGWTITAVVVVGIGVWIWAANHNRPTYPDINSPRPSLGQAEAPLKLEEFSDFQCPACKLAEPTVKDVLKTFGDKLFFSYLNFPLLEVHPFAWRAALAAECANDQGKYWEYHDKLFEKQPAFSGDELVGYARDLGIDTTKFSACLDSQAKASVVRDDMHEGDRRGVDATPTFFLNGQKLVDWTKLKEALQAKLIGGQ